VPLKNASNQTVFVLSFQAAIESTVSTGVIFNSYLNKFLHAKAPSCEKNLAQSVKHIPAAFNPSTFVHYERQNLEKIFKG
jgi:hypothetical protein